MNKIAVIIPAYKVRNKIKYVLNSIPDYVDYIVVIDDACPENTYSFLNSLQKNFKNLHILKHSENKGVGGAVITGYIYAKSLGASILVKVDGDGQMDTSLIHKFVNPIIEKKADYTKGNRFYNIDDLKSMPTIRILGNSILSFFSKVSSGYWNIFDPTNGYTAIHVSILNKINLKKISNRFFFETDMLFHLNIVRAVVKDIPISAIYLDEKSNLKIKNIFFEFLYKHINNTIKRVFYNYVLRDMTVASIQLPLGLILFVSGVIFGSYSWVHFSNLSQTAPTGTVVLTALLITTGLQLFLSFLDYDINSIPKDCIQESSKK